MVVRLFNRAVFRNQRVTPLILGLVMMLISALPLPVMADLILSGKLSAGNSQPKPVSQTNDVLPESLAIPGTPTPASPVVRSEPSITLDVGDTVTLDVYGKPEMKTTAYIADDGTVLVPLVGPVKVAGLAPVDAGARIAKAFKDGELLVNPQVSVTVVTSRSQQVSVLGEVGKEGRYTVDSGSTVFDLIALAGGISKDGATVVYLLRTDANGSVSRTALNLDSLANPDIEFPNIRFKGGDTLYVPRAGKFYIQGEVVTPSQYRLQPNMTVSEAIATAGGITRRGSSSRVEIKRRKPDGTYATIHPKSTDPVMPDDVIRVKESIF